MSALPAAAGPLMLWAAERLVTGAVHGALVIGTVWLVCRGVTSMPASARALLWWLASLKLVLTLLPLPALPLALLPPQAHAFLEVPRPLRWIRPAAIAEIARPDATPAAVDPAPRVAARSERDTRPAGEHSTVSARQRWVAVAVALWMAGLLVQAMRLLSALRRVRGVASRSVALGTEEAAVARRIADDLGLSAMPEVRVSDEIDSPQVVGLRRPIVLLPTAVITALTPNELAMTLCHELVHVRRHDLAFGWVPALAERLFFFHPLARFAADEYLVAREAACDAAVLRALDVAPQEYGRLLMRFGITRFESRFAATGASPSTSSLRRRLDMLHHTSLRRASRRATWLLGGLVALCLLPFQLVARTQTEPVSAAPAFEHQRQALEQRIEEALPEQEALRGSLLDANALRLQNLEPLAQAVRQEQIERRALEELRQEAETQLAELRKAADQAADVQALDQELRVQLAEELERRARQQFTESFLEERLADARRVMEAQLREAQDGPRAAPVAESERLVRELEFKLEVLREQLASQPSRRRVRAADAAPTAPRGNERRVEQQTGSLEQQIERLTQAQKQLEQLLRALAQQQETIAAAQRQLTSQSAMMARILEAVEKAAIANR